MASAFVPSVTTNPETAVPSTRVPHFQPRHRQPHILVPPSQPAWAWWGVKLHPRYHSYHRNPEPWDRAWQEALHFKWPAGSKDKRVFSCHLSIKKQILLVATFDISMLNVLDNYICTYFVSIHNDHLHQI